ncbi:vinculin [Alosa alosa]|uniref:vinculin n=1 Tax=Alosa alosa TaxID=278164 RepID=UPI002015503D|nr:vinculin [Alosa alosa]
MAQYLKRKGPIHSKEAFVSSAKTIVSSCQSITQFLKVIADHCLDKHCAADLALVVEQILTITNQLTIISSVNALTPGSKSSDESLVKNAQNLLQIVLKGVRAAETACIKLSVPTGDSSLEMWQGLRQPEPNTNAARAAALCFQWKKNLLIHRALEISNPETDDLGLRKTSPSSAEPSLAPPLHVLGQQNK